jgi:NNP family nitrate/nitrite transporter-like MFS transporter
VSRPLGGWLADRHGGARVAQASFVAMAFGIGALAAAATRAESATTLPYGAFVALFSVLFIASGIGNGAVFQLIPAVFVADRLAAHGCLPQPASARSRPSVPAALQGSDARWPDDAVSRAAVREGALEGAAALGLASGVAAFGGFFIPKAYGTALSITGSTAAALYVFLLFYLTCIATTWWFYLRPRIDRSHFRGQHGG